MLRVLDQGVFKEIVVDDFVPCDPTGRLLSTQPTKRRNLWPIIMEKVWAKVCGNYSLIQCIYILIEKPSSFKFKEHSHARQLLFW
jgi:hypothetical protein